MPRCCEVDPEQFAPSYASVLVAGHDLKARVEEAEEDSAICPCVTAWCNECKRVSMAVADRNFFPRASAHLAHALVVRGRIEETLRLATPA